MNTTITFLDADVEIVDATRHGDTVAVEVYDQAGNRLVFLFHEDLFALLAQAAVDAVPYRDPDLELVSTGADGWTVPVDTACPDDPDGLHFVGCGCGEVAAR